MELKIAWWNCHISAPSTKVRPEKISDGFLLMLFELLLQDIDILCLGEVNQDNCDYLAQHVVALGLENEKLSRFRVISLYAKTGNKIDDFGIIYNAEKVMPSQAPIALNTRADVTDKYLKIGKRLPFTLLDGVTLWVILCHWQSHGTYRPNSHIRSELGSALRASVNELLSDDPDALIAICGDFNDEPFDISIQMALKASRDMEFVRSRRKALFNPFWRMVGVTDLLAAPGRPPGTCYTSDPEHMTHWKTFDQIILSSGFLRNGWGFAGRGAEIVNTLYSLEENWIDVSDHFPVMCSLKKVAT